MGTFSFSQLIFLYSKIDLYVDRGVKIKKLLYRFVIQYSLLYISLQCKILYSVLDLRSPGFRIVKFPVNRGSLQ